VIDTHVHFYPPEYQKAWIDWESARGVPHFPTQLTWSPERALEAMDRSGISCAVLSVPSTPGLWFDGTSATAQRMARICNDYAARMMADFPGRYALFATLPMLDTESTLREIDYVFETLRADGIGLQSSYGDRWLGDPSFRPVFDELDRRKAVVYVHPVAPTCCTNLSVGALPAVIEVPHDTTRTVTSLLLSGGFARWRNIRWLFSHAGGTVPMMAGRIEAFYGSRPNLAEFAPAGILGELRRLYYDTANATSAPAVAALRELVPTSHITYGTDYPYFPFDQLKDLAKLKFSAEELRAISSENALTLLPRLKRPA
jgi:6-methylsalicylate decarboxylase